MLELISKSSFSNNFYYTIWFWFSILELFIIILLIIRKEKDKQDNSFYYAIKRSKKEDKNEDMRNVVNSIFYSKNLYDKLKVKCHPDKFNDEKLKNIANNLFQIITENKGNLSVLQEIESRAKNELNIEI